MGPGGGRGHAAGASHPGRAGRGAAGLQEQRGRQGRLLRHPRELSGPAPGAVPVDRGRPAAVLRGPPGAGRCRSSGAGPVLRGPRVPDQPARGLHRGRDRPGDDAETAHHQHPRRAALVRGEVPPAARHRRGRHVVRCGHPVAAGHHQSGAGSHRGRTGARARAGRPGGRDSADLPRPGPDPAGGTARWAPADGTGDPGDLPGGGRGPPGRAGGRGHPRGAAALGRGCR